MEEKLLDIKETSTKTIAELKDYQFVIEKYQRGYRWGIQEVVDLLEDINEYTEQRNSADFFAKFYCLQPLVVKTNGEQKELIDGQQRATTLYIVLSALGLFNFYTLSYTTRGNSNDGKNIFLDEISNHKYSEEIAINKKDYSLTDNEIFKYWKELCLNNDAIENSVDNFYFFRAFQICKIFLKNLNSELIKDFKKTLLYHTRVIWYEKILQEEDESVASSFLKFNDGKISLEQAELIKALFVLDINKEKDITRQNYELNTFAEEWNEIEHNLQNDRFWYFVSNKKYSDEEANRINLLFEIIKGRGINDDRLHAYRLYNDAFKNSDEKPSWNEIGNLYSRLEEWFQNRRIYHLVGAIINLDLKNIEDLNQEFEKIENKEKFEEELKKILSTEFIENGNHLKEKYDTNKLKYGDDNVNITRLLILFNIAVTEIKDPYNQFPFNRLKNIKSWTLEHILAQNVEDFDEMKDVKIFRDDLKEMVEEINKDESQKSEKISGYFSGLNEQIEKDNLKSSNEYLKAITKELNEILRLHEIENICLLDNVSNIKFGKKIFKRKRNILLGMDKIELGEDAYIPLTTRLVFQKSFSKSENINQMVYWSENDREDYRNAISEKIQEFLL